MEEIKEKKQGFFRRLQASKKKQMLFFAASMAILIVVFFVLDRKVDKIVFLEDVYEASLLEDDKVFLSLDEVFSDNKEFVFSGWIIRLEAKISDVYLVFKEVDEKKEVIIDAECELSNELQSYVTDSSEFGNAGFRASIDKQKLNESKVYEVCVYLECSMDWDTDEHVRETGKHELKISTQKYFYNGMLYNINPLEYVSPKTADEKINEVVSFGEAIGFNSEKGIWVYLYNTEVYVICKFEVFGEYENRPEIPFFIFRVQENEGTEDKYSLQQEYYLGHYLEEQVYQEYSNDDYYMYSIAVPQDEAIAYLHTGVYHNRGETEGWLWRMKYLLID